MSIKDVKPGNYRARAVGGQWVEAEGAKKAYVEVGFEFENDGKKEHINHKMYLSESTIEKTMDTLIVTLGYDESKTLLEDGKMKWFDKTFLADKEVEIVLEHEEYEKKTYTKVKWVNELGGAKKAGSGIQQALGNANLKELAAAARARMGAKKAPASASTTDGEDVPF